MTSIPPVAGIEIVVTARRLAGIYRFPNISIFSDYWSGLDPVYKDTEWLFGPFADIIIDDTPYNHPKKNLINGIINKYLHFYENLRQMVALISDYQIILVGAGFTITGADLKAKIAGLRTVVTDNIYPNGYAGANYGDRFEINWQDLGGYVTNYGQNAVNYLICHEIAHNTMSGIMSRSWLTNSFADAKQQGLISSSETYSGSNLYFILQEAYANYIGKLIGDATGINVTPPNGDSSWPPNGYVPL